MPMASSMTLADGQATMILGVMGMGLLRNGLPHRQPRGVMAASLAQLNPGGARCTQVDRLIISSCNRRTPFCRDQAFSLTKGPARRNRRRQEDTDLMPLSHQTRQKLRKVSAATISTALFKRGFRNQMMQGVSPLDPATSRTWSARPSPYVTFPAREDLNPITVFQDRSHPQRKAVEECPAWRRLRHRQPQGSRARPPPALSSSPVS